MPITICWMIKHWATEPKTNSLRTWIRTMFGWMHYRIIEYTNMYIYIHIYIYALHTYTLPHIFQAIIQALSVPHLLGTCSIWPRSTTPWPLLFNCNGPRHKRRGGPLLPPGWCDKRVVKNEQRSTPYMTFHYTDWFIGIFITATYNPYTAGCGIIPFLLPNNHGFGCCSYEHWTKTTPLTFHEILVGWDPYVWLMGGAILLTPARCLLQTF